MKKTSNTYKLAVCAIMVALGAVLSLVKVVQMPFGGSVTLLSMLPCAMVSIMFGLKWGFAAAFVESVVQLAFGVTMDGILGWGLTPAMLIGTLLLDYILAFTVIGFAGIFRNKGYIGICVGTGSRRVPALCLPPDFGRCDFREPRAVRRVRRVLGRPPVVLLPVLQRGVHAAGDDHDDDRGDDSVPSAADPPHSGERDGLSIREKGGFWRVPEALFFIKHGVDSGGIPCARLQNVL